MYYPLIVESRHVMYINCGINKQDFLYKIRGGAYDVRNELGRFLHERPYQMAMKHALTKLINFGIKDFRDGIHIMGPKQSQFT